MELIIGNKNYSSWSLRPWILLKHAGLAFKERSISLSADTFPEQISVFNAADRVPLLIRNGQVIWESLAICETLAEQRPDLWPSDSATRAEARALCCEMHAGFSALRNELPMNCRALKRRIEISAACRKDLARIDTLWHRCRERFADQGPWLFGRYSVADAFFAPVAIRLRGYQLPPLSDLSEAYCATVINDPHLHQWIKAGAAENEILIEDEAGEEFTE